jgi:hypothetical protein
LTRPKVKTIMRRHWRSHAGHGCGCHTGFMSVEDEVAMLEKAKEYLEAQLGNINERLEKLKE